MTQEQTGEPKRYRTLGIILGILVLLAIILLAYALALRKQAGPKPAALNPQAGLGELGAQCGGELRLPCRPGLACVKNQESDATGVCTKISDEKPGKIEPPNAAAPEMPKK